jgi:hypothetical protein
LDIYTLSSSEFPTSEFILKTNQSQFHFFIIGVTKAIESYFLKCSTNYPPSDYSELNGVIALVNFLNEIQKSYIKNPKDWYLLSKEQKIKMNQALNIFTQWKNKAREKEIKSTDPNFGSALPYTKWIPNELNEKFLES